MDRKIRKAIKECVSQELLIAKFYRYFARLFEEDRAFWQKIMKEEIRHGTLLLTKFEALYRAGVVTEETIPSSLRALLIQGSSLTDLFLDLQEAPPTRQQSFTIALALENCMSEQHFRSLRNAALASTIKDMLDSLGQDEEDHIQRIQQYAANLGFDVDETVTLESSSSVLQTLLKSAES